MAAFISWVCRVDHAGKSGDGPPATVTIHRGQWAYCPHGDLADCIWEAIQPTTLEQLRALGGRSRSTARQGASQRAVDAGHQEFARRPIR